VAAATLGCIVALVVVEIALHGKAAWVPQQEKAALPSASCYTTDPADVMPVDLRTDSIDLGVDEVRMEFLREHLPHCVTYDSAARRRGFFPERPREAYLVGDSFTFGEGLTEADTLGRVLGELSDDTNYRTFATSGANVEDVREQVRAVPDRADVIYVYCLNDVDTERRTEVQLGDADYLTQRLAGPTNEALVDFHTDFETVGWHGHGASSLLHRTRLARFLSRWSATRQSIAEVREQYEGARAREVMSGITAIAGAVTDRGGRFVMLIHPLLYKDDRGHYPFDGIHETLLAHCESEGLACVDGREAFDDVDDMSPFVVHRTDYHPNRLAHERTAALLRRVLPDLLGMDLEESGSAAFDREWRR